IRGRGARLDADLPIDPAGLRWGHGDLLCRLVVGDRAVLHDELRIAVHRDSGAWTAATAARIAAHRIAGYRRVADEHVRCGPGGLHPDLVVVRHQPAAADRRVAGAVVRDFAGVD